MLASLISILLISHAMVSEISENNDSILNADKLVVNSIEHSDTISASDSVSVILPGLEVTGSRSFHTSNMSTYIPTAKEKNVSMDAMSLLDKLMIPQIAKDADRKYKALNGTEITYYVNGHPAQPNELGGLNVNDVSKVCYLDHPSDSRYLGAQYVIEFIVKQYQYGGYASLSDNFYFLGETHFQEGLVSKFTYKRMTYDLYTSAQNFRYLKSAKRSHEIYRLHNTSIERQNIPIHSKLETEVYPIKFRAVYSHANTYISNEIGIGKNKLKTKDTNGEINFNGDRLSEDEFNVHSYDYSLRTPIDERSITWNGFTSFVFGKGWSLTANPSISYSRYNNVYAYETSEPFSVNRNVKEKSLEFSINATLTKKLNSRNTLGFNVTGKSLSSHSRYTGDETFVNKFEFPKVFGSLSYSYRTPSFSLSTYAGIAGEWNKLNDLSVNTVYPYGVVNIGYSGNRKTQYSLWMQYSTYSPLASLKNPTVVRQNELFYRCGNPELKPYPKFEVGPSFVWSASDAFTLSASAMYTHLHDIIRTDYTYVNDGDAIMESFSNNGNTNVVNASLFASLRLFNGKLNLSARPQMAVYRGSRLEMPDLNSFGFYGSGQLYLGNFLIGADFMYFGKQYLGNEMTAIRKRKPFYEFTVRWGKGPWKVGADLINIFQTSWEDQTDYIYSSLYTSVNTEIGIGSRQTVIVGFSYILGYGKKIDRQNELEGGIWGASSTVL